MSWQVNNYNILDPLYPGTREPEPGYCEGGDLIGFIKE